MPRPNHRYSYVTIPPKLIQVDVNIAPLLTECWRRGWTTYTSCQGQSSKDGLYFPAYISFSYPEDGGAFLRVVTGGKFTLQDLRAAEPDRFYPVLDKPDWTWGLMFGRVGVYFPPEDLDIVTCLIRASK